MGCQLRLGLLASWVFRPTSRSMEPAVASREGSLLSLRLMGSFRWAGQIAAWRTKILFGKAFQCRPASLGESARWPKSRRTSANRVLADLIRGRSAIEGSGEGQGLFARNSTCRRIVSPCLFPHSWLRIGGAARSFFPRARYALFFASSSAQCFGDS